MYATTGLSRTRLVELAALIHQEHSSGLPVNIPPSIGLFKAVTITSTYLRRNRTQQDLAETFGTSQPTISRVIAAVTAVFAAVFAHDIPTVYDLDPDTTYVVDGTLLPCWSWADYPELYSGKHRTTGVNVQIAATLDGHLAWVSDPTPGSTHDLTALRTAGVLDEFDPVHFIGDKGYVGAGMITPDKKPPNGDLTESQKKYNKEIGKIRSVVERTIANLKTWRIFHTDYRRPCPTFAQTITAVLGLENYRHTA